MAEASPGPNVLQLIEESENESYRISLHEQMATKGMKQEMSDY